MIALGNIFTSGSQVDSRCEKFSLLTKNCFYLFLTRRPLIFFIKYTSLAGCLVDSFLPGISITFTNYVDKFVADWTSLLLCIISSFSSIRIKRWFSLS